MKKKLLISITALLLLSFFGKATASTFAISWEKLGFAIEKTETSNQDGKKDAKEEVFQAILTHQQVDEQDDALSTGHQLLHSIFKLPESFHLTLERPPNCI